MSEPLATYSFLPWLRQGLANNITQADNDASVMLRASIPIHLTVSATKIDGSNAGDSPIDQPVELYGPGDIVGIDSKAIVKTEPRNRITNFEPNYLPYIDFYDEDFPWRYTPAHPDGVRLRPWITLVVLKEDEFDNGTDIKGKPLPFFKLKDGKKTTDIFPLPSELWAWAHVHVNTDLSNDAAANTADAGAVTAGITNIISQNPDLAYSRILSPRKLEANIGYYAFVIPTFESGRLSGLGLDLPDNLVATKCSWDEEINVEFPYYTSWYFKTGSVGDFEYLVNLLKPKPADKRVGIRDIDVLHPGSNLPPINDPALKGVLKLGGALRVPFDSMKDEDKAEVTKYDEWDEHPYPHPFSVAMSRRINLADDYTDAQKNIAIANGEASVPTIPDGAGGFVNDPDPVITSPLYGRWHALQSRLLKDRANNDLPDNKNWVHELNLDPRFRVAAGLGTMVLQKGQEEYMQASWAQVGKIIEANNKIRLAQLAMETSSKFFDKHIVPLPPEKAFVFTAPVQKRVGYKNLTAYKQVAESVIPQALLSGVARKITRPRGSTMKKLALTPAINATNLFPRINAGEVIVVPPKGDPAGAIKLTNIVAEVKNVDSAQAIKISQINQKPQAVDLFPTSHNFTVTNIGSTFIAAHESTDSPDARNFKAALKDVFTLVNTKFPVPGKSNLNFADICSSIVQSINPATTIPKRTFDTVKIPSRIIDNMVEKFTPVLVYPVIDLPMYKPLSDISSELLLPNINLIEQNSITLLENNQKFIESYMVGINHEMSRELLWREYPTDQRGTYFRQFWDVSSFLPPQPAPADLTESLRDIPPIHKWFKTSVPSQPHRNELGQHNQRALASGKTQLVLVIRGELLKKYPTAVVYAQRADWGLVNNVRAVTAERVLVELTDAESQNPPTTKIKTPLFEAKMEPDIYFFGFDLDDEEARGTLNPTSVNDDPGWFFVIKERPGEPRFGLDIDKATNDAGTARLINWNNLSWPDIGTSDGACIKLEKTIHFDAYDAGADQENKPNEDDVQATWDPGTHAAGLAYILYQVPVLVGVHASRMLPK